MEKINNEITAIQIGSGDSANYYKEFRKYIIACDGMIF